MNKHDCEYNHIKNAGNMADVWKHRMLCKAAELIKPGTYFETHCGFPWYPFDPVFLSSYMKVRLTCSCVMTLCDTNSSIAHYMPVGLNMNFLNVNGWEQVQESKGYDLCFIDPPYISMFDFVMLEALLEDDTFTKPLIAWYPLLKDMHPVNYDFGLPKIEVYFEEGKLFGCGMVFKNIPEEVIKCIEGS